MPYLSFYKKILYLCNEINNDKTKQESSTRNNLYGK